MKYLRWLLWPVGVFVALVASIALWGWALPLQTSVTRSIDIARPPSHVWAVMDDTARAPRWQPMVARVTRLNPKLHEITYTDGIVTRAETELSRPPHKLVEHTLPDPAVPFRASWSLELTPIPTGTRVTLQTAGEIDNPLIRWAQRYIFTLDKTAAAMLRGLKREAETS